MLDQCSGLVDEEVVESAGRGWAFIEMMGEADDVVGVGDFEEAFSPGDWRSCALKSCSLVSSAGPFQRMVRNANRGFRLCIY